MGKDFKESVDVLFNKIEDLVSTKTVVGEAIVIGDLTLLPLIEVAVGAGAGAKENVNAAGGVGAKITPSAVLVIQNGSVQTLNIKNQDAVSKLIDMAPGVASKLNFGAIFGNRDKKEPESDIKFEEKVIVEEFEK
ncbi:MAG: sporulation protein [Clostridia bacterium]|nr:GerW family sporulation protein [Anaerotignum sp.]NCC15893.1 sporulation protein [Clostridia bacterium]